MARWKEPIRPAMSVTPYPQDGDLTPGKWYTEHETDMVIEGQCDREWFYPQFRVIRHFVDGVLVKSDKIPLPAGEDKPILRQSLHLSQ
jgi:hypothetical protein